MKDSLITELENFTKAIQRWDGEGLSGVSKKIFDALDNFWYETIVSWLTESKWSKSGIIPTMDEYFKVGMTSIATHTLLLPASYFLKPSLKISQLQSTEYAIVTKLVMIICRLLNDIQSYETTTLFKQDIECKEKNEGKPNSITVYLKNNPEVEIEEAIDRRERPSKHFIMNELSLYAHNKVGNWKRIHIMPPKLNLSFI
ncbi:hypothetical protein G4B88_002860 [Cannabis sativa]|uniref:Terpene synthase metal-binding domain-containing protein n=1 Tax=Cannabis sativa TaxID=3483 RepID=A0A7J6ECT3_CANSA|nr:hypothetical protein G4B88_002860 [Cannabis sativa]